MPRHILNRNALSTTEKRVASERLLDAVIEQALAHLGFHACLVDLSFVADREMRALNKTHRGKDKSTDVLSFPSYEGKDGKLKIPCFEPEPRILGSIVIAIGTAHAQAKEQKHSFAAEVTRLTVHSVCHLAGYDHERSPAAEKKMFACEDAILKSLHASVQEAQYRGSSMSLKYLRARAKLRE